ncbi:MAG: tRNA uridine-5-carboxymethylaminomethyl(34) synthesis GTPase MnmE [Lachnospiraceae bacterium]|nr:tRNA uridine-5-carboxymethylaminomethyl(34) synthesis GTPase MnmE [Lachnospiraceae bacterium]
MLRSDTIAAVATSMNASGIGIIRISGTESISIVEKIFCPAKKQKKLTEQKSYTIHYGTIVEDGEVLDEVIVLLMRGPHSYTAEDTVEIDCHGGVYVMHQILNLVIKKGARVAEPGEFTKRAFLNGRIDLSQAEAVIDVISSQNTYALKSSIQQLKGSVQRLIKSIREKVLYEIAYIESALDDPEHISLEGYPESLHKKIKELLQEMERLLKESEQGKILREGIRTAIIGKPNAGKSSLLNALLGEERAIVTEIAGTTRDTLEEQIRLRGLTLQMIDTAGIRKTGDKIEQIGVERAKQMMEEADLILYVIDASSALDENDKEIMPLLKEKRVIVLLNKTDLQERITAEEVQRFLEKPVIRISAKEEKGLSELADKIEQMFLTGGLSWNDEVYLTNLRQKAAMEEAKASLQKVEESILLGMSEDFYSIDLMDAYEALGRIIGESVGEDLVNEIFEKFCMGK